MYYPDPDADLIIIQKLDPNPAGKTAPVPIGIYYTANAINKLREKKKKVLP